MQALLLERQNVLALREIDLPSRLGPTDVLIGVHALALIASGKVDLQPLVTETYAFADSVAASKRAAEGRPGDVKLQIVVGGGETS